MLRDVSHDGFLPEGYTEVTPIEALWAREMGAGTKRAGLEWARRRALGLGRALGKGKDTARVLIDWASRNGGGGPESSQRGKDEPVPPRAGEGTARSVPRSPAGCEDQARKGLASSGLGHNKVPR